MKSGPLTKQIFERAGWTYGPTQRSVNALKPGGGRMIFSQDLFGMVDAIAFRRGMPEVIGLQNCLFADLSRHQVKCCAIDSDLGWSGTYRRLFIVAHGMVGPRGKRKTHEVKVCSVTMGGLGPLIQAPASAIMDRFMEQWFPLAGKL